MITAERKPLDEIITMISPYKKLLVVGCGSCVAECAAGGERETGLLASALRMEARMTNKELEIREITLERQCVYEFIDQLTGLADQYDAVLSLACGAGVQAVAEVFPDIPILPALNTLSSGRPKRPGCGWKTAGDAASAAFTYLPISVRSPAAPNKFFNGPCGGSQDGQCEVNPETPCAWHLIITRLEERGQLNHLEEVYAPADWSKKQGKGFRKIVREDQQ